MDIEDQHIGRRVREVRHWRGMSLTATAGLAGISAPYLSLIERGQRPVTKRVLLEALAHALKVSAAELTGKPYPPNDPVSNETHAHIAAIETALDRYDLGTDPEVTARPWPELAATVTHLDRVLRAEADYAAQSVVLPGLLAELHATYVQDPEHRQDALIGLLYTYRSAASVCKNLGVRGLPLLASRLAQTCAEELGIPAWIGFAAYLRGIMSGPQSRAHQYALSVRAIDQLNVDLANPNTLQVAGTLHLNAALACAAQGDTEQTESHLDEAAEMAGRLPERAENFGGLYFGPTNVGFWRVTLGAELEEGAKVAELARGVHPETVPLRSWQATFYADLGRALASERRTREQGIQAIVKAEEIAPQFVRNNVFVRETVSDLVASARRDAGGRELRGLAWRMGVAPNG